MAAYDTGQLESTLMLSIRQLAETIGKSSDALGTKIDRLNKELGESKAIIETAGKKVSDISEAGAREVSAGVGHLTEALTQASAQLRAAGDQSVALGQRLNWLTFFSGCRSRQCSSDRISGLGDEEAVRPKRRSNPTLGATLNPTPTSSRFRHSAQTLTRRTEELS